MIIHSQTPKLRKESSGITTPAAHRSQGVLSAVGISLFLAVLVCIAFGQAIRHEFVNYDDDRYVYDNPKISGGLALGGVGWAFTHVHAANWHPLTTISHMLDCQLYGLQPWGHHLTNILLHATAAILLFFALRKLTSRSRTSSIWPSAFAAALFAIHPLRVESVAWISERKDVLSGVFFMLTLWTYACYTRQDRSATGQIRRGEQSRGRYFTVVTLFALGLMCKPTLVTLPFVLLLLDYWPLQRVNEISFRAWRPLVIEKIPLLVLSVASCAVTLLVQQEAIAAIGGLPFHTRLGNSIVTYVAYLGQTIYPVRLAPLYPYPEGGINWIQVISAFLFLSIISIGVFVWRKRYPYLVTGWLWFLGMLAPMIGLVQVGPQARADRYTYLPEIGLYILAIWGAIELVRRWRNIKLPLVSFGSLVIIAFTACSYFQTSYWQNGETLWRHTINVTARNYIAHNNFANWLLQRGRLDEAMAESRSSLAIEPTLEEAHVTFANTLLQEGNVDGAIAEYRIALQLRPDFLEVRTNLGNVLLQRGQVDEAIAHYEKAIETNPNFAPPHSNLGNALLQKGQIDDAIHHYQRALEINPRFAEVHNNLGNALLQRGQLNDAAAQYQQALALKPDYAEAEYNLGNTFLQRRQSDDAIAHYRRAIAIDPDYAEAYYNLGKAFAAQANYNEAIRASQAAIRIRPNYSEAYSNLGCFLTNIGNTDEAIKQFNEALRINADSVEAHYNLGHLLAQLGRPPEAVAQLNEVLRLKPDSDDVKEELRELGVQAPRK